MITFERVHNAFLAVQRGDVVGFDRRQIARIYARAHTSEFFDDYDAHMIERIELIRRQHDRRSNLRVVQ